MALYKSIYYARVDEAIFCGLSRSELEGHAGKILHAEVNEHTHAVYILGVPGDLGAADIEKFLDVAGCSADIESVEVEHWPDDGYFYSPYRAICYKAAPHKAAVVPPCSKCYKGVRTAEELVRADSGKGLPYACPAWEDDNWNGLCAYQMCSPHIRFSIMGGRP